MKRFSMDRGPIDGVPLRLVDRVSTLWVSRPWNNIYFIDDEHIFEATFTFYYISLQLTVTLSL